MIHIGSTPAHPEGNSPADWTRRRDGAASDRARGLAEAGDAGEEGTDEVFVSPPPMPWPRVFPPI